MPEARVELARRCRHRILSPARLPFRHSGAVTGLELSCATCAATPSTMPQLCRSRGLRLRRRTEPLPHRRREILLVDDVVAVEHRARAPAAQLHDLALRHPGPPQVARGAAPQVVRDPAPTCAPSATGRAPFRAPLWLVIRCLARALGLG